jgi:hypothetical protein
MGLADGLYGAIIGAAISAAVSFFLFYLQKKNDKKSDAERQRKDIARAANLLIIDFQHEVLSVAARSTVHKEGPDVKQGVSNLSTVLTNEKTIIPQLQLCCAKQADQLVSLEKNALTAVSNVHDDAFKLFNVCMNLSNGLTSIQRDLVAIIKKE